MDKKTKAEWFILLISAGTDGIIAAGGILMATHSDVHAYGSRVLEIAIGTGLVAAARTIQQALKSNPQMYIGA